MVNMPHLQNSCPEYHCNLCEYTTPEPNPDDLGNVSGNTKKYLNQSFPLWRCPRCKTIHSLESVDFEEIYRDYPLNSMRKLDIYARQTLGNLLKRLKKVGVKSSDTILDLGCGNAIFVKFLYQKGFKNVDGYDPYVDGYRDKPNKQYDVVVLNDVLEHVEHPGELLNQASQFVRDGGLLYVGTADSAGVGSMKDLKKHTMRLHQPFHRKIITQNKLQELGEKKGFIEQAVYSRSYMDTMFPFGNYRFLDEFSKALGYNMDLALDPKSALIVFKKPYILFYAFFGYFFPSAEEPAVIWKIQTSR